MNREVKAVKKKKKKIEINNKEIQNKTLFKQIRNQKIGSLYEYWYLISN